METLESLLIVENPRDQRTLDWLRSQVSDDAIRSAVAALPGRRKPYLSSICKALKLEPPSSLEIASKETARAHCAAILEKMRGG